VYLPGDSTSAVDTAMKNATMNGFKNDVDGVKVQAQQLVTNPTRLKVDVTKTFSTFFARAIGFDTLTVHESATADYDPPVALGSPENSFGYQPYRGVWGAINGYCASREDGDLRASRYHSNRPLNAGTICPLDGPGPYTVSSDYDANGYSYLVEMKQAPTSTVALQVFDGPFRPSGCGVSTPAPAGATCPDSGAFFDGTPNIDTTFEVWDLRNPIDQSDDVLMTSRTFGTSTNGADFNHWDTLTTLPTSPGVYRVKVYTKADQPSSVGSNGWALGARIGGSSVMDTTPLPRCVNDVNEASAGVVYDAGCPHVYAEREMSVFANKAGDTATFYLAEVGRQNAGKTMLITLFDPGEGGQTLEVLDPSGNPVAFSWKTIDPETGWPQYSGSGTSLDISQHVTRLANHQSDFRFSDRKLQLQIDLPDDYNPSGTDWCKLKYQFAGGPGVTVSDRTTWGARIVGNPIRLVE
jgi:hypothetical protein